MNITLPSVLSFDRNEASLYALALAARERRGGLSESDIPQPDLLQGRSRSMIRLQVAFFLSSPKKAIASSTVISSMS